MKSDNKKTGKTGEDIAAAFLKKKRYKIIERNYKCVFGEVDIVARDMNDIVFIEVKSRKSKDFGEPEDAVTLNKQRKISKVALNYLKDRRLDDRDARFDVIAIKLSTEGSIVKHIKNAFELAWK
jgi:putative endonuclease